MKRWIAGIVIIIAILAAATPYVVGWRVESLFKHHVARVSDRTGYPVRIVRYDRGWLHSRAVTRVSLQDDVTLTMKHRITHGPYGVSGWADIESTPVLQGQSALVHYFGDKPALTVDTLFGFGGDVYLHATSPAFRKKARGARGGTLVWGGARINAHYDGKRIHYKAGMPKLVVKSDHGELSVSGAKLRGEGSLFPPAGSGDGGIDWASKSKARVQKIFVYAPGKGERVQASLRWHMKTGLDKNGNYGVDLRFQVRNGVFSLPRQSGGHKPFEFDKAVFHASIQGVPTKPLAKFIYLIRHLSIRNGGGPEVAGKKALVTLQRLLPRLLAEDTRLVVEIPPVQSNLGKLGLQASASFAPVRGSSRGTASLVGLMQRTDINLHAFAARPLLERLLSEKPHLLRMLVARDFLQSRHGRYDLKVHFGQQGFTVNGQAAMQLLRPFLGNR